MPSENGLPDASVTTPSGIASILQTKLKDKLEPLKACKSLQSPEVAKNKVFLRNGRMRSAATFAMHGHTTDGGCFTLTISINETENTSKLSKLSKMFHAANTSKRDEIEKTTEKVLNEIKQQLPVVVDEKAKIQ